MPASCRRLATCLLVLIAAPVVAQTIPGPGDSAGSAAAAGISPACNSAKHRQFDFWLGAWDVHDGADGAKRIGGNVISRVASGCALAEQWTNAKGQDGRSLNVYEVAGGHWTQFWIGGDGMVLRLSGGLGENGAMTMEGALPDGNGGEQRQRIVWTPQTDGSVQQRWQTSNDGGAQWVTVFLGTYRRRAESGG